MSKKYRWRGGTQKSDGLTPRQIQVLTAIGDGLCTKEIARKLNLSDKAIEKNRESLYKIMKTNSVAKLVKLAVGFGLSSLCLMFCFSAQAQFMATTNTATLGWNPQGGITSFSLYYWTGPITNVVSVLASQTSAQVINLQWNSQYTFALKAVNLVGTNALTSAFSAPVVLMTPQPPLLPPPAPTGLSIQGP